MTSCHLPVVFYTGYVRWISLMNCNCHVPVLTLITTLRETIMNELNCEKLREQLDVKPSNKVHIWNELKLLGQYHFYGLHENWVVYIPFWGEDGNTNHIKCLVHLHYVMLKFYSLPFCHEKCRWIVNRPRVSFWNINFQCEVSALIWVMSNV